MCPVQVSKKWNILGAEILGEAMAKFFSIDEKFASSGSEIPMKFEGIPMKSRIHGDYHT